ncbi:MAG: lysozyme family protein [Eubacterium sp.]|nr:lysozyme family protein [Eubacterium sp.]
MKRRKKHFIIRFTRAYRKAPWAVRVQVTVFLVLVVVVIALIVWGIVALFTGGDGEKTTDSELVSMTTTETGIGETMVIPRYKADVDDRVRSYEGLVGEYCKEYKIYKYRELVLALIKQESDGQPPDIMQAEESPYNHYPPIADVEESVLCGVQELRDCMRLANVRGPSDIDRISIALQGYNYGQGYIRQTLRNGEGYTSENAAAFSEMMKQKLGTSVYGDPEYVPHVLRYYKVVTDGEKSGHSRE